MAKKKVADQAEETPSVKETAPDSAVEAIRKSVELIDPKGKRHIPSGEPAVYQEVLDVLYSALEPVAESETEEG